MVRSSISVPRPVRAEPQTTGARVPSCMPTFRPVMISSLVKLGVRAAEVGVLVCASKDGLSVGAERCWKYLKEQKKPCIVYISKEDEENANFSTTLEALREKLSKSIAANGIAVRRLAQAVGNAGDIQHALHQGGFPAAAVTKQADVANVHRVCLLPFMVFPGRELA